jgi:anti-sigma factor RsiW
MSESEFDTARAKQLIGEISDHLAALPADNAKYAELRAEVDALKAMLERPDAQPAMVQDSMKSVHGSFDRAANELRADGIRVGQFLSDIGRMLGLD